MHIGNLTNEELELVAINLIKNNNKEEARKLINIYHKLIRDWKYYKKLANELQIELDECNDH